MGARKLSMLSKLKVIDLSTVLAGPSVGMFFAELGAEVIKIEHPTKKDVTRSWKLPTEDKNSPISAYFSSINYNKKLVALDLSNSNDLEKLIELVKSADILLSNFKFGDAEKFGITDKYLSSINPKLIIGKINGYGDDSPKVAYDLILQAETGFMSMNGTPESGPVKMPVALIDVLAGHQLKEGILLALYERETTGKGKSISVSLYDTAISSLMNQASNYLMNDHIPTRIGSLHPNIAPYGEIFNTKDGELITFAIGSETQFHKLCEVLGITELIEDERYNSNQNRVQNRTKLEVELRKKVLLIDSEILLKQLQKLNVPVGKINNLKTVFENKNAQDLIREENIEGIQTKRVSSIAFK
jgi:crotonobetainyl-CoA:carnitine CoA-transferase CaiB-like acyl-CoA transferase